jgi:hypothetical protein
MAKRTTSPDVATVSSEEANVFVTTLQKKFQQRKRTPQERERLRKYLAQYPPEYLRSVARRVFIDIVKGPGQTPSKPRARSRRTR